jgi:ATP-dependent Clp protease protease subunit
MSVPFVIEKGPKDSERVYDLFSRLLKDRIVFVRGGFDQNLADVVTAQLLYLESSDPEEDIYMYVNSPGGDLTACFAIFDVMQYIKNDIVTVGIGQCMSAGSFILAAGTKGKRYALPNTEVMIHELSSGTSGKFNDMLNRIKFTKKQHEKLARYYRDFTGQSLAKIKKDMERDYFMTAEEAVEYGILDEIHEKRVI